MTHHSAISPSSHSPCRRVAAWPCKVYVAAAAILLIAIAFGLCAGHQWAHPHRVLCALLGDDALQSRLLLQWRLPRVLAAALVGALLGVSGAIFQGIFRNPLAEPYLLGASGGAALGATFALLVPMGLPVTWLLPALAFLGAWGSTALVLLIARAAGSCDAAGMLLAGVAIAAMLSALRSFLMLALSDETVSLQVVMSWVLGGIQTPNWSGIVLLAGLTAACLLLAQRLARGLDLLGLGTYAAQGFGLHVARFTPWAVMTGSLIVSVAVAYGGLVAFVGLAAPHVARWMVGALHRHVLPMSALIGATVVTLADALARAALPPAEIPLGLVTAVVGAPFFLFLLAKRRAH